MRPSIGAAQADVLQAVIRGFTAQLLAGGYTVIATCHNLGIPTRDYLIDVMTRLEAGHPLSELTSLRPDIAAIERGLLAPGDYLHQQVAK